MSAFVDFPRPPKWTERAICAQVDPELFYPDKGGTIRPAVRICSTCPVKAECLAYGLELDDEFGIWGGVPARGRRAIRRAV